MFDWFWEFLYSISKSLFQLVDGLMSCANMLVGIDEMTINGNKTDLITYLFYNENISFAFRTTAVIGIIVLVMLTIISIVRIMVKDKVEDTPGQVCVKAFKSFLLFMLVPFIMIVSINLLNVLMKAIYQATSVNASSIGRFLFISFAPEGTETGYFDALNNVDWASTSAVEDMFSNYGKELSDYSFVLSYIAAAAIMVNIAFALLSFVDRAISIVLLFIVSPFSIASSVLDGGARFKLWRDQVLIKFIMGYGTIIAINIYILVVSAIIPDTVVFFDNNFLNNLMKILIIIGGALSMKRAMSLVGNLVSSGAGSQEVREAVMGRGALMRTLGSGISGFGGAALGMTRAALHPVTTGQNTWQGIKSAFGYGNNGNNNSSSASNDNSSNNGSSNQFTGGSNSNQAQNNVIADSIRAGSNQNEQQNNGSSNLNNNLNQQNPGNSMVANAIMDNAKLNTDKENK